MSELQGIAGLREQLDPQRDWGETTMDWSSAAANIVIWANQIDEAKALDIYDAARSLELALLEVVPPSDPLQALALHLPRIQRRHNELTDAVADLDSIVPAKGD